MQPMKVLALSTFLVVAQGYRSDASPIGKVVEMLQGMLSKGKALKNAERVEFAKTEQFCAFTRKDTKISIQNGADNIEQLKATIGKALSDAEVFAEEVKAADADTVKQEAELATAGALREKENKDYMATHVDFSESIDAIAKATKVIAEKSKDVKQSLLQIQQNTRISAQSKATIQSFAAMSSNDESDQTPKAAAYESQTGGVTGILEKLKLKFEDQRTTLEKEEAATKAAFELLKMKLEDSIRDSKKLSSAKTTAKTQEQQIASTGKGDLDVAEKAKTADETALSDLNTKCDGDAKEYDQNQVTRANEIKAMETALSVLGSDAVSGTAKKHGLAAVQDSATALSQLRSQSADTDKRRNLVKFLQSRAAKLGSKYLSLIASRAMSDPFASVKKMIKELIVKLMEDANAEADQKGYCDTELGANKVTRDDKTNEVDTLTASVEKLAADIAQMSTDVSTLSSEITALKKSMSQATDNRNAEKKLNTETINEGKAAQVAVERATQVLRDFYGKKDAAATLLQDQDEDSDSVTNDMAQVSRAPYTGMDGGGVFGMLEVILSDFAKLEAETSSAEDEASTTYQTLMDDSIQDSEVKDTEMNHIVGNKQKAEETLRNQQKELKATQEELDAAIEYYEKLRPDCVDTGLSYQDRIEMRQQEIQSLQEALTTLAEQ